MSQFPRYACILFVPKFPIFQKRFLWWIFLFPWEEITKKILSGFFYKNLKSFSKDQIKWEWILSGRKTQIFREKEKKFWLRNFFLTVSSSDEDYWILWKHDPEIGESLLTLRKIIGRSQSKNLKTNTILDSKLLILQLAIEIVKYSQNLYKIEPRVKILCNLQKEPTGKNQYLAPIENRRCRKSLIKK